ncbi:MAG: HDOD domain-containing protein [Syntrophales bacterium]|nr:HDOD domain-containing protein [Syntrophales bacterium]
MDERFRNFLLRIKTFKHLPTLPHILIRLIEVCNDENISLQELSRILTVDPGLTARVLYLANSSYYRNQDKIAHIDQALFRMGRNTVKNLVLSAAVHKVFDDGNGQNTSRIKKFWRHSLLSAVLARTIALKTSYPEPEQAFFTGMIHDIGRLVLSANFPEAYAPLFDFAPDESDKLLAAENTIGAPHTEVGAWLLSQWNLDSFTVDAVLYHHESAKRIASAFPLVKIVYAANLLAEMTESGDVRCDDVMAFFSFGLDETTNLIIQAEEETEALAQSLDIDIGPKSSRPASTDDSKAEDGKLSDHVEGMAMLFGTLQSLMEAVTEEDVLQSIHEGIRIIFDTPEVLLFLYDRDGKILKNHGDPYADRLMIPVEGSASILGRSLLENTIISTADIQSGASSIMDEQLARRLGKKELISAPLIANLERVGILVIGLDEEELAVLSGKIHLLKLFANVAAMALHADRTRRDYERRVQSERLAAVTALMRRVAHEINNPLGIIKNFLLIVSSKLGDESGVQKELRIIREEIDRIVRILPELSDAEKSKTREKVPVDLNALISDMAGMIEKSSAKQRQINMHLQLEPDLPQIKADKDGMKQILINLVKNSLEAIQQGGNIFIGTEGHPQMATKNGSGVDTGNLKQIRIIIRDDGPGIDPAVKARLFEPCVSTKGKGHSGIGLSVVYRIMKDQGGDIKCESIPGVGTTFILTLPVRP